MEKSASSKDEAGRAPDVALFGCAESVGLVEALRAEGMRIHEAPDLRASRRTAPPRIALLEGRGVRVEQDVETLRARWPLVDVVVWAPEADAQELRALLKAGARDVVPARDPASVAEALAEVLEAQQILPMVDKLSGRRSKSSRFEGMLSRSHAMWDLFDACERVAATSATILISGETGTGKELFARALHRRSKRRGRLLAVNCSALPEHLIESELFGHEKGAFTGAATARKGIFRDAERGSVFLDEIGDMPESAQLSLLRVLEEKRVRPVGASSEIPVDVRIVAATNVPLEEAVAQGRFREDLFYRIDVIRLDIPPLRDRREDIVYLFGHFLKSLARHYGCDRPEISDAFLEQLVSYPWPGNVRELENVAERVVLRAAGKSLGSDDFPGFVHATDAPDAPPVAAEGTPDPPAIGGSSGAPPTRGLEETLRPITERAERQYLESLLRSTRGHMTEAAAVAKVSRRTLQRKLAQYGIDRERFRGR